MRLRLFAAAREAAGTSTETFDAARVSDALAQAVRRYGVDFERVLDTCRIWVNGEPATPDQPLADDDEVAVLPPVSGGCR